MTNRENIIYYTLTAVVFVGIVVCSLLFHNPGQSTNGDNERKFMTEIISTIVIAAAAVITAGATIVLASISKRYVRLTGSLLKATYKPDVLIFQHSKRHEKLYYIQSICVKNVGVGIARKIRFGGDLAFQTVKGSPLNEIYFIQKRIDALAPGQEISHAVTPLLDVKREDHNYPPVWITVTYEDMVGEIYKGKFKLDFNDVNLEDLILYVS